MDAKRRLTILIALFVLVTIFIYMIAFGVYENLIFFIFIAYFIISSLFLRPKARKRRTPSKSIYYNKEEKWSAFDTEGPEKKDTEMFDKPKISEIGDIETLFKKLYFGEEVDKIKDTKKSIGEDEIEDTYGGFRDITENEIMKKRTKKPMVKDPGTILFEKITANAKKKKSHESSEKEKSESISMLENEDEYGVFGNKKYTETKKRWPKKERFRKFKVGF